MRPFSASIRNNINQINFGRTALQNIRKSFDKFKIQKDQELFSRLHHRLETEKIKSKRNKEYKKRDIRYNTVYKLVQERKKLTLMDTQIKNYEKFINHQNLYNIQNQKHLDKISKWRNAYKRKERKEKIIKEEELNKKIQNEKGYPKDIIIQRLNDIKQKCELKIRKIRLKLTNKDNKLKIYKAQKEKYCEEKRQNLEYIIQTRNQRINQLNKEQSKQREEMRKEIEKKIKEYNKFLYAKEIINEQKRNISDYYNNKYQIYTNHLDNILYKKDLDNVAINQINMISNNDPALAGLTNNFQ